eukprot:scaffold172391_cov19-Tisochrysis_lutea.AAC.1
MLTCQFKCLPAHLQMYACPSPVRVPAERRPVTSAANVMTPHSLQLQGWRRGWPVGLARPSRPHAVTLC